MFRAMRTKKAVRKKKRMSAAQVGRTLNDLQRQITEVVAALSALSSRHDNLIHHLYRHGNLDTHSWVGEFIEWTETFELDGHEKSNPFEKTKAVFERLAAAANANKPDQRLTHENLELKDQISRMKSRLRQIL